MSSIGKSLMSFAGIFGGKGKSLSGAVPPGATLIGSPLPDPNDRKAIRAMESRQKGPVWDASRRRTEQLRLASVFMSNPKAVGTARTIENAKVGLGLVQGGTYKPASQIEANYIKSIQAALDKRAADEKAAAAPKPAPAAPAAPAPTGSLGSGVAGTPRPVTPAPVPAATPTPTPAPVATPGPATSPAPRPVAPPVPVAAETPAAAAATSIVGTASAGTLGINTSSGGGRRGRRGRVASLLGTIGGGDTERFGG